MESTQPTQVLDGGPPESDAVSNDATSIRATGDATSIRTTGDATSIRTTGGATSIRTTGGATSIREAMLSAIGDLSDEERERLGSAEQPDEVAQAWRDLIAERAAQEREATVRTELTREFESRTRAAQPRPTSGLRGGPPAPQPATVSEWTDFIRSTDAQPLRQQRRAQFADWLAAHPEA